MNDNLKSDFTNPSNSYHVAVLLKETLDSLLIKQDGIYVDCTFGGGGHSRGILDKLSAKGKLVAFDQDEAAAINIPEDERVLFVPHNFRHLQRFLRLNRILQVDGILADLSRRITSHYFSITYLYLSTTIHMFQQRLSSILSKLKLHKSLTKSISVDKRKSINIK